MAASSFPYTEQPDHFYFLFFFGRCVLPISNTHQYNMTEDNLRAKFEQYGEIKTFFSLIEKRGMLFVTYVSCFFFDLSHRNARSWPYSLNAQNKPSRHWVLSLISELQNKQSSPCKTPSWMGVRLMSIIRYPRKKREKQSAMRIKIRWIHALELCCSASARQSKFNFISVAF